MQSKKLVVIIIVLAAVAAVFMLVGKPAAPPAPPTAPPTAAPVPVKAPATPPQPQKAPEPAPAPEAAAPAPTPAPAPVQEVQKDSGVITEETLVDTKWGIKDPERAAQGKPVPQFEFAPDHVLKIAGTARAKWKIENNQLIMYSDDGESHVFDIVNGKLSFEGKTLEKL